MPIELTPEEFRRQYDIPQDAQFRQEPTEQSVRDAADQSFWSNPPTAPAGVVAPYYHTRQGLELADSRLADRQANLLSGFSADSIVPDRPQPAGLGIAQDNPEPYGGFDLRDSAQPGQSSGGGIDWQGVRNGIGKIGLALEAFGSGFKGQEPLYLKLRKQQALEDQHKMVNEQNKSARLLDLMKFQQAQQHQHLQAFLEADKIADPKQRKAVGVSFEQQGNPYGKLLQVSKEANGMKPLIGWLNQENPGLAGQLESALPNMSTDEVKHWMDMLTPMYKQFTEQQTKANALQRLNAIKNPSPTELLLKQNLEAELMKAQEEHTARQLSNQGAAQKNETAAATAPAEIAKAATEASISSTNAATQQDYRKSEIDKNNAQTARAKDKSDNYGIFINAASKELFDKPFEQLSPLQRTVAVNHAVALQANIQGAKTDVDQRTRLVPPEKLSNLFDVDTFRKTGKMVMPKGPVTQADAASGKYLEANDKQRAQWEELKIAKGVQDQLFNMSEKLVTSGALPGDNLVQAAKLHLGAFFKTNPDAAAYLADKQAFASRIARMVEVGVMTNQDVSRWENIFPGFFDTVGSAATLKVVANKLMDNAMEAYKAKMIGDGDAYDKAMNGFRDTLDKAESRTKTTISTQTNPLDEAKRRMGMQ